MDHKLSFEVFRNEWLSDVTAGNPSTVELGNRFSRKLLTQWLDIDETSDDIIYCDGSGDGGIDIAHLYESDSSNETGSEAHSWYLVQSKYGCAFQGSSTLFKEGLKLLETLDKPHKRLSSLAEGLVEQLTTFRRQASERDRIILVFATEEPLTNAQAKTLKDIRVIGRDRLGTIFDVESVSIETIYQRTLEESASSRHVSVPMSANTANSSNDLIVCSVSLTSLYDFMERYQEKTGDLDQLYEKNVRRFLGGRGKVNKAIQQTLKDAPEQFGLYNNGITIVVTDYTQSENGVLRLVDPYIVNGCQTTRTIWDVLRQRLKAGGTGADPEMKNWHERAKQGIVITKIVKVGPNGEDLLQKITRYTNSQNAVREKDFLALVSDFQAWKHDMEDRYHIFLEIQRGAWDSQRARQKQHPNERQFSIYANAFDLLKVYGAGWLGEAGTAFGRNAAFLPNGVIFKQIINNESSSDIFDSDDLYAAYRLQAAADEYNFGRGGQTTRRLTRFLFCFVVIELLKTIMIRAELTVAPRNITHALLKLFQSDERMLLLDTAIQAIDEYLTPGTENSVFDEPSLKNLNSNLSGYLKWDQLGKEGKSPIFKSLIADYGRQLGRGKPSPREVIAKVIRTKQ